MGKWIKNWFSNMIEMDEPLWKDGIRYDTVENYYQAMKTRSLKVQEFIASMKPWQAKRYVKGMKKRDDWDEIKLQVMEEGLRHKFQKGTIWYYILIKSSGEIVEWNNWNDKYWGKCVFTKEGENNLGKLLMKIREEYRNDRQIKDQT